MKHVVDVHVPNESGVFGARIGVWKGLRSVFTHKNPKNGKIWGEDLHIESMGRDVGMWVNPEEVTFI